MKQSRKERGDSSTNRLEAVVIGFESESGCVQVQGIGGGGGPGEIQQCLQVIPGQHREGERETVVGEREFVSYLATECSGNCTGRLLSLCTMVKVCTTVRSVT